MCDAQLLRPAALRAALDDWKIESPCSRARLLSPPRCASNEKSTLPNGALAKREDP